MLSFLQLGRSEFKLPVLAIFHALTMLLTAVTVQFSCLTVIRQSSDTTSSLFQKFIMFLLLYTCESVHFIFGCQLLHTDLEITMKGYQL